MAKKEFIFQGITARTHGDATQELFDIPNIQRIILSVAFISEDGVKLIEKNLKANMSKATVFAGIRNDITSLQGLLRLYACVDNLYTVDTGSRSVLFHPKLYLVRGEARARLLVGSANLTLGGMNNNIEAGILLDFDLTEASDKAVVDTIETQFTNLLVDYPAHIVKVGIVSDLNKMLASGRLIDEAAPPPPRPLAAAHAGAPSDTVPRIKLKVERLYRPHLMVKAKPKKKPSEKGAKPHKLPVLKPGIEFELVWESTLAPRDLPIPKKAGTNAPGSFNLDKGMLPEAIDHRHYFREDVFSSLEWQPATKTTEEAFAKFHLIIKGISIGEFNLRIGHTIGTDSKSYKQNNAMTRLSWGGNPPICCKIRPTQSECDNFSR